MKTFTFIATIEEKERLNSDSYGNPRYYLEIKTEGGQYIHGNLSGSSPSAYGNFEEGERCEVEIHYTRKGNAVFDRVTRIK